MVNFLISFYFKSANGTIFKGVRLRCQADPMSNPFENDSWEFNLLIDWNIYIVWNHNE